MAFLYLGGIYIEHANYRHRQPERRRWQDNHLREPGDWAGAGRKESAADRRGPAGLANHYTNFSNRYT